jgi:hypothetical protein
MREGGEHSERLDLVATILLAVATVASAWCTYQSELWNSEQLEKMADANVVDTESLRASGVANRNAIVDAATYANLLQSESHGDERAARFILSHARPAFRPILDEWYSNRAGGKLPPGSPFEDPRYRAQIEDPASSLRATALTVLRRANEANANSDRFLMRTVLLAMSLFFLGISGQLRVRNSRRLAVVFGALVLIVTLLSLTRLPIAPRPGRAASDHTDARE